MLTTLVIPASKFFDGDHHDDFWFWYSLTSLLFITDLLLSLARETSLPMATICLPIRGRLYSLTDASSLEKSGVCLGGDRGPHRGGWQHL